jgi:hypothetical protein
MSVIVEDDIFLTKQQSLNDEVGDGSNDEENGLVSFCNTKEALREIEALDRQLDNFEFDCNQIDFVCCQPDAQVSGGTDEIPMPKAPTGIDIDDLFTYTAQEIMGSSINAIERNKNLCSTANHMLTVEEEERIATMMLQEHEDIDKYGSSISSTEKSREAELDELLLGLGYDIDNDDDRTGGDNIDSEDDITSEKGDPILRELAKKRTASLREQKVDQALQMLLLEPLPRVVRTPKEFVIDQNQVSPEESPLAESISDEDICHLVLELKQQYEDDGLVLADRESIRALAKSILDK